MSDVNPNPESTWGKTPAQKQAWYAENTENYDPATYVGSPTATAPPEGTTPSPPPASYPTEEEAQTPDYVADTRPPEEVSPPFMPEENSGVDYFPMPDAPPPPPVAPVEQSLPVNPPVGMLSGSVDETGISDEMTVEKFDAEA